MSFYRENVLWQSYDERWRLGFYIVIDDPGDNDSGEGAEYDSTSFETVFEASTEAGCDGELRASWRSNPGGGDRLAPGHDDWLPKTRVLDAMAAEWAERQRTWIAARRRPFDPSWDLTGTPTWETLAERFDVTRPASPSVAELEAWLKVPFGSLIWNPSEAITRIRAGWNVVERNTTQQASATRLAWILKAASGSADPYPTAAQAAAALLDSCTITRRPWQEPV
ncbi:hypothetical protein ACIHFD_49680 [Nonomuraea sp. NPDC051941]|uniref:hypothetical protein n=1 Tax=Nonomuraea sp. NPDC051941 TaxID=3364373 RepID=UPI0037C8AE20